VNPILLAGLVLVPTTAFLSALFARAMRARALGQRIRDIGPSGHAAKAGTPTMGGAIVAILWSIAVGVLSSFHGLARETAVVLSSAGLFALIGAADDVISLRKGRSLGLTAFQKIALSTVAAAILYALFLESLSVPVQIPFARDALVLPPAAAFVLVWVVCLATTNGVNLTDGLDGLASGVSILILVGIVLLRPTTGNATVCLPLIAVLAGFLWSNAHPAALILGDVGAYFLGGVLAALALANGLAFVMPFLAGVLVLEVGSVILQVAVRRTTGRRLFRMTPLHHHFEIELGVPWTSIVPGPRWSEERIVVRFWILQAAFLGLGLLAGGLGR
jgi:phospho-N-acetylmuramoyl-pentapeptide-transferase